MAWAYHAPMRNPGRRPKVSWSIGLGIAAACTVLAACGSSSSTSSTTSGTDTATTTLAATTAPPTTVAVPTTVAPPTTAAPTTEPATTAPPATTTTPAGIVACSPGDLTAAIGNQEGAMGSAFLDVIVTNVVTRSCTLSGYPVVTLLDAGGQEFGDPAALPDVEPTAIELAPGGIGRFTLHTTNGPIGGPCLADAAALRVVLTPDTAPIDITTTYQACGGFDIWSAWALGAAPTG